MTLLLLSNSYKIKSMKQKVSCNIIAHRDPYMIPLQNNVMPLQIVRAFNRIRIISNSNLNLTKRKERNLWTDSLNSNNPIFDKRSCIT